MAQSQQISAEDLNIQSATMSGRAKLFLSARSSSLSIVAITERKREEMF